MNEKTSRVDSSLLLDYSNKNRSYKAQLLAGSVGKPAIITEPDSSVAAVTVNCDDSPQVKKEKARLLKL